MIYGYMKPKKRSTSVLPFKYRNRISIDKKREKSNIFQPQEISENLYINKNINENKISIFKTLLQDIKKYRYQNQQAKTNTLDLRDIDIIKEKQNEELISKISTYLEQKKQKVILLNKLN